MNTKEPDPQAVKCYQEIIGSHDPDFTDRPVIIIARYLKQAREEDSKRLVAECDSLKGSNAELREQHVASAKFISELQHLVRLAQGTHAKQIHECAKEAAEKLSGDPTSRYNLEFTMNVICTAFGAPLKKPKDECEEAWEQHCASIDVEPTKSPMRKQSFWAAWKLAKGEKP